MKSVIKKTETFVRNTLKNAETGHDWWHAIRVRNNAMYIYQQENCKADKLTIELAALLHDIADSKFNDGDENIGAKIAKEFLERNQIPTITIDKIINIISNISFSKSLGNSDKLSLEGEIIQDADRLDALGAIGIARTFNYGGFCSREIYNPNIPPIENMTKEEYKNSKAPTINHFYEKLLNLKHKMNTKTGIKLAETRHEFMINYLNEFFTEWKINE
jgi:uncharacterized protein